MSISTRQIILLALSIPITVQAAGPAACSASVPSAPTVRSEGKGELTGDIVIPCTGGVPTASGTTVPQLSFTAFLNVSLTSRTFNNSTASDVLLLIDEPGSSANPNQLLCANTS